MQKENILELQQEKNP